MASWWTSHTGLRQHSTAPNGAKKKYTDVTPTLITYRLLSINTQQADRPQPHRQIGQILTTLGANLSTRFTQVPESQCVPACPRFRKDSASCASAFITTKSAAEKCMQAAFSHQDVQRRVTYIHWFVVAPQASENRKNCIYPLYVR